MVSVVCMLYMLYAYIIYLQRDMTERSGPTTTPNQPGDISRELQNFLEELINFTRHAYRANASRLISLIRSDAPNERIPTSSRRNYCLTAD
jgi:hypothetical protein